MAKPSLALHPVVLVVDECQKWFEHPAYGKELEAICEDLVRRGPSVGIVPLFATQRPDAKSLPTGISANAVLRFCLKVIGHQSNDMVLGTGAHKAGIRATMFTRKDLGIGWLLGESDDPQIVRTFKVDNPTAARIAARARVQREHAGTLAGHATGEDPEQTARSSAATSLLADILAVIPPSEERVWSEALCQRLAELRPETYGGWNAKTLASALKPLGVQTGQQWAQTAEGDATNRKGVVREHVRAAQATHGARPGHLSPGPGETEDA